MRPSASTFDNAANAPKQCIFNDMEHRRGAKTVRDEAGAAARTLKQAATGSGLASRSGRGQP
jgi:hypothetical protein